MDTCLRSSSMSILVNGSPSEEFRLERGVRQGDPLLPFLSILAAEGLKRMVTEMAEEQAFLEGVVLATKYGHQVSGLKVNYNKSKIYGIGVNEEDMADIARWMECGIGEFPFTHLGLPIGENMRRVNAWGPVVEKFKNRIADWKLNRCHSGLSIMFLKYGSGLGLHFIDSFGVRGLNIGSLRAKNMVLLGKWRWGFKRDGGSLWVRVIKSIHGNSGGLGEVRAWGEIGEKMGGCGIRGHGLTMGSVGNGNGDKWRWVLGKDREFTFKELARLVEEKIPHVESGSHETLWNKLAPKKVNIFVWRALKGRLLVHVKLDKRGIDLDSVIYPCCNNIMETCAHYLVTCDLAMSVWEKSFQLVEGGDRQCFLY
ncbi:reverse transcriptase domain, reverse transcriptase zinc-binding domain protein [Tanacetum coccineum]